jgi:hypothetical protein
MKFVLISKLILRHIWKKFKNLKIMYNQATLPRIGLFPVGPIHHLEINCNKFSKRYGNFFRDTKIDIES